MTKKQSECTHTKHTPEQWIKIKEERRMVPWDNCQDENTFKDISDSQYKCTQCGLIFNYSGGNPHHVLDEKL